MSEAFFTLFHKFYAAVYVVELVVERWVRVTACEWLQQQCSSHFFFFLFFLCLTDWTDAKAMVLVGDHCIFLHHATQFIIYACLCYMNYTCIFVSLFEIKSLKIFLYIHFEFILLVSIFDNCCMIRLILFIHSSFCFNT